jgi:hypothetical protein
MMLTFHVTARCQGCGQVVKGAMCAFTKRINLNSFVTKDSFALLDRRCGCDPNDHSHGVEVLESRLTEESAELVEKAREKIRARRKRAA